MALLEKRYQHYILLKEDGIIEIHRSLMDRMKQKLATQAETILKTYNEKIDFEVEKIYNRARELGYDPDNLTEEEHEFLTTQDPFIIEHAKIAND